MTRYEVTDNPDKIKHEGRRFRVRDRQTGRLSDDAYWTNRSAKIAMKNNRCTFTAKK